MSEESGSKRNREVRNPAALAAIVVAVLAVAALVVMYWFPPPSAVLGLGAVVLGVVGRSRAIHGRGSRDIAVAAIVLGVVAILGNGLVQQVKSDSEEFGRHCAAQPTDPDC